MKKPPVQWTSTAIDDDDNLEMCSIWHSLLLLFTGRFGPRWHHLLFGRCLVAQHGCGLALPSAKLPTKAASTEILQLSPLDFLSACDCRASKNPPRLRSLIRVLSPFVQRHKQHENETTLRGSEKRQLFATSPIQPPSLLNNGAWRAADVFDDGTLLIITVITKQKVT